MNEARPIPPPSGPAPALTERQRLDEATQAVFARMRLALWVFDIERKAMVWANEPAIALWNAADLATLLARDFSSDMSRATETRLASYLERFRRGDTIADRWTFYPLGTPRPVTVLSQASAIDLADGRLAMLQAATLQVDSLESESVRMVEVLRHSSAMITVISAADGRLVLQNPASVRAHGGLADAEGAPGSSLDRLVAGFEDTPVVREAIERALRGEEVTLNLRAHTPQGLAWHEVKVHATRDPVTRESCVLLDETNIDELRRAQERNRVLERDALEQRMAGGFAHEVRNSLSSAKITLQSALGLRHDSEGARAAPAGLVDRVIERLEGIHARVAPLVPQAVLDQVLDEMAAIGATAERLDDTLRLACASVERTLQLTTEIMQASKAGHERPGTTMIDVPHLVRELLDGARAECLESGVTLQYREPSLFWIRASPEHLRSIVGNLVRNAREALTEPEMVGAEHRTITVTVACEEGAAVFVVEDNGPGVPPELREKIFEPFFSTKPDGGTGLGLGVVRKYVEIYGGELTVASEVGAFTRFRVALPGRGTFPPPPSSEPS